MKKKNKTNFDYFHYPGRYRNGYIFVGKVHWGSGPPKISPMKNIFYANVYVKYLSLKYRICPPKIENLDRINDNVFSTIKCTYYDENYLFSSRYQLSRTTCS